ncbi:VOC family protein [Paenibacillus sp. VCA1]|uniref:VOC family protein n=1 Tax=Paenibacillus sp. VCA1 TaxID=3039148 RepID=UPI002871D49D|nr:VOC family protein [Paenibacillus sp. VCA1]MDR9854258.1 VOC family protein [Paenibacillus sp. VCA1]
MTTFHSKPNIFVGHVHLKVSDLARSLAFYRHVIGFRVLEQSERKAVMTADGKTPMLTIEQPEQVMPKQPRTTGLYHFAILLPKRSDLACVLQHFIQHKIPLQGASDHLVSEALYLADPDGNGIEIYADRPSSSWAWGNGEIVMDTVALDIRNLLQEGAGQEWKGLPEGTLMGHIHLHVSFLQDAEAFYIQGLGFEVVCRLSNQALFISTGQYHHHIGFNTWNGVGAPAPAENSVGLTSFDIVYPTEAARTAAVQRLKSMGVSVQEDRGAWITEDPSKNRMRLVL